MSTKRTTPLRDKISKEYMKLWGPKNMPTALVTHGTIRPGKYPTFALLGWVEQNPAYWPSVGLHLSVLNRDLEKQIGAITVGMPLLPKTERQVCGFLQDLGWDGRVWPYQDHGWPEGTTDEAGLLGLLKTADLGASLTFPSDPEKGVKLVNLFIEKSNTPFPTAPFGETVPKYLEELRKLAADPTPFKSDWHNDRNQQ